MCVHLWSLHALLHSAIIIIRSYRVYRTFTILLFSVYRAEVYNYSIYNNVDIFMCCILFYDMQNSIFHSFSLNSDIIYDLHTLCHRSKYSCVQYIMVYSFRIREIFPTYLLTYLR